jgi:hypothetical protein
MLAKADSYFRMQLISSDALHFRKRLFRDLKLDARSPILVLRSIGFRLQLSCEARDLFDEGISHVKPYRKLMASKKISRTGIEPVTDGFMCPSTVHRSTN